MARHYTAARMRGLLRVYCAPPNKLRCTATSKRSKQQCKCWSCHNAITGKRSNVCSMHGAGNKALRRGLKLLSWKERRELREYQKANRMPHMPGISSGRGKQE